MLLSKVAQSCRTSQTFIWVESKPGRCRGPDGATELHKLSLPSPAEEGQHTPSYHSLLPPEHQQVPQTLTVKEVV